MERLTGISPSGHIYLPKCYEQCGGNPDGRDCLTCPLDDELIEKLAAYEDWDEREEANKAIFRRALDTYGAEAQTRMVFEEFAELQKELCKHARGKDNRMEVAEEIADVFNVLDQMVILYDCADEVAAFRKEKLLRLAEKMEEDV